MIRVENGSPQSSCGHSPRQSSFSSHPQEGKHRHIREDPFLDRTNSSDDIASQHSLSMEPALNEQFTPHAERVVGDMMPSFCMSSSRPDKVPGVSPVNLPLSLNIPVKMEDAPEEDREAAQALVSLADCNGATPACQGPLPLTLGQKRGFGDLSVNTSIGGGVIAAAPMSTLQRKKRRAVAAARRMSMKLYSSVPAPLVIESLVHTPTPSFQRTLSVLAATATELCTGDALFLQEDRHDRECSLESAVCIQLSQKY